MTREPGDRAHSVPCGASVPTAPPGPTGPELTDTARRLREVRQARREFLASLAPNVRYMLREAYAVERERARLAELTPAELRAEARATEDYLRSVLPRVNGFTGP